MPANSPTSDKTDQVLKPQSSQMKRWMPLAILVALIVLAYALGVHRYFSLDQVAAHRDSLNGFVANHLFVALLAFAVVYISATALSLPIGAPLSILGGFLFGWTLASVTTVIAATIGSAIVFQIVKTSLGAVFAQKAGPFVSKLSQGFARDAFHYLLFLRLVPAFPFFAVNAVAGLSGIRLQTFVAATFIGIIPATVAFSYLGTGLGSLIDAQQANYEACMAANIQEACTLDFSPSLLLTREIVIAFFALGIVALIPVFLKRWKNWGKV